MEDVFKDYDYDNDGFSGEFIYGDDYYVAEEYMDEKWKRAKGLPDYFVSDKGRVYSGVSNRFISGTPTGRCGHIDFSLHCGEERFHRYAHRMVAEAFIPNPDNHPIVRHLDDDPSNNYVDNLAWGTQLDNVRDAIENGTFRHFTDESRSKAMSIRRTPVIAVNFATGEKTRFESQQEASRTLGVDQSSVNAVLRGKSSGIKGYYFIFESGDYDDEHFNACKKKYGKRLKKYLDRRIG